MASMLMAHGTLVCTGFSAPRATRTRGKNSNDLFVKPTVVAPKSRCRLSVVARGKSDFTVPEKLISLHDGAEGSINKTSSCTSRDGSAASCEVVQYTLRFYTGPKMGQGLSAPDAGVQVMLIGEDGRAFMQRVDRYPDVAGMADLALYSHSRFERGNIDEVTFDAPDLGLPAALWVAPESGGEWFLEEVELSCSDGSAMALAAAAEGKHRTVSYPCMEVVGGRDAALELRPSVFVKMTAEQRETMRVEGLREYGRLKVRMLAATGAAVLLGCAVAAAVGASHYSSTTGGGGGGHLHDSLESMRAFAAGGGVGLVYLWMLTRSVDTIGVDAGVGAASADTDGTLAADVLVSVVSSGPVRLLLLGLAGALGSHHVEAAAAVDPVSGVTHPAYGEAFAAVLGFFSYKAGVLVAGFSGTGVGGPGPVTPQHREGVLVPIPVNDNRPRRVDFW